MLEISFIYLFLLCSRQNIKHNKNIYLRFIFVLFPIEFMMIIEIRKRASMDESIN